MPTATATRKGRKSPAATAKAAAAAEAKAALLDQLEAFMANDDQDAAILARVDYFAATYSMRNACLIVMQDENATEVHGFRAWQGLGRQVRKGEKSRIHILAPAGQSGGTEPTAAPEATPAGDAPAANGEPVRKFFRLVAVFDIAQTDPIPAPAED